MRCVKVKRLLTPYHDERLDEATRAEVDEHLGGCAECRAALAAIAGPAAALGAIGPEEPPEGLARRAVAAAFAAEPMERPSLLARLFPAAWPAAIAAASAAVLLVVLSGPGTFGGDPGAAGDGELATMALVDIDEGEESIEAAALASDQGGFVESSEEE